MTRVVAFAAVASALTLTACDGFGQAMTSHTDVLARAAGHELSVEQVTNMLAPATRLPAQPEVVDAVANLWVDYTLLATAAAEDSTFQNQLDLDAIIVAVLQPAAGLQLRERVITGRHDDQRRGAAPAVRSGPAERRGARAPHPVPHAAGRVAGRCATA
jgi:hypothetical protein